MGPEILIPILITLGAFTLVFGIRYLNNKERMAMIEKGMNPAEHPKQSSLKFPAACVGFGTGLLLAFFTTEYLLKTFNEEAIYFSFILLCVGIAMIIVHSIEDKRRN